MLTSLPAFLFFSIAAALAGAEPQRLALRPRVLQTHHVGDFRGGARSGAEVFLWGGKLARADLRSGRVEPMGEPLEAPLAEGGCLADVNADGKTDVIALEAPASGTGTGRMVWLAAPGWEHHLIDTEADFRDCLAVSLFGRQGVLVLHRRTQLRFYLVPRQAKEQWDYRELYSIYTPSAQGGLAVADVDEDGFPDVLMGNYWVQSPAQYELHWRLFAIHNWWEEAQSAMVRLALLERPGRGFPVLAAAEAEAAQARLAWFERPPDPRAFWVEHRLTAREGVHHPKGLAAADLDGDGWDDLALGERNGARSRLLLYRGSAGGFAAAGEQACGPVLGLWTWHNGSGVAQLLALERERVVAWRIQRRR